MRRIWQSGTISTNIEEILGYIQITSLIRATNPNTFIMILYITVGIISIQIISFHSLLF